MGKEYIRDKDLFGKAFDFEIETILSKDCSEELDESKVPNKSIESLEKYQFRNLKIYNNQPQHPQRK